MALWRSLPGVKNYILKSVRPNSLMLTVDHRRAAGAGGKTPSKREHARIQHHSRRANRWLAPRVDGAFVYFAAARDGLRVRRIEVTGMPGAMNFSNCLRRRRREPHWD